MAAAPPAACVACAGSLGGDRGMAGNLTPASGEVRACLACGTAQVVPRPDALSVAAVYSQAYFESYLAGPGMKGGNQALAEHLHRRLETLEAALGGPGRLVDVGCAYGLLVAAARDRGWDAEGVEPSAWAAAEGARRFGITIHPTDLEHAPVPAGSLDVVHANHVLEHLIDPGATLAAAHRLLRPSGVLVVEVPQELRRPLTDRLYGALHPELYPRRDLDPTHLEFFSAAGLRAAARRAGFEPVRVTTVRHLPNTSSRLPVGSAVKSALVRLEELSGSAPDLLLWARKPRKEPNGGR